MYNLEGRVAIVTGGGRGIGRAIALRLVREGADISVVDLDLASAESVVAEVDALGRRGVAVHADVTKAADTRRIVEETAAALGRIDILVNNAGVQRLATLLETTEADWDLIMTVNVKATWLCSKAVAAYLIEQNQGGRIINASSRAGKTYSSLPIGAYVTSKHAIVGFTRQLALELAPYRITVNAYCPGVVDTPMWELIDRVVAERQGVPIGSVKRKAVEAIPLGRIEQPEDVAKLVAFLASDESDYMTGQAINITGGSETH